MLSAPSPELSVRAIGSGSLYGMGLAFDGPPDVRMATCSSCGAGCVYAHSDEQSGNAWPIMATCTLYSSESVFWLRCSYRR